MTVRLAATSLPDHPELVEGAASAIPLVGVFIAVRRWFDMLTMSGRDMVRSDGELAGWVAERVGNASLRYQSEIAIGSPALLAHAGHEVGLDEAINGAV